MKVMSLCQGPGVQPAPLSPLISRCSGQVICHGAAQKGKVIGRVRLLLLVCTTIMKRDACVYIGCVSGFVLQPMLRGNHVSRSAISDSELEARKLRK